MSGLNVALIIIRPIGGQQVLDQLSWNLDGGETKGLIMVSRSRNAVRADSFTQSGSFMVLRRVLVSGPMDHSGPQPAWPQWKVYNFWEANVRASRWTQGRSART